MPSMTFYTREEWLEFRRSRLGASDSAAALGESPWKSPYALWMEKTGQAVDGDLGEAAEWGLALEETICRVVAKRTGRRVVVRKPFSVDVHPVHDWLTCTLDARQWCDEHRGPGTLQVKTANAFSKAWEDDPPLHYQIQLQHEMAVCGYSWGSLVVLVGGQRLLGPFDYKFLPDFWAPVETQLERFWGRVLSNEPPDIDDSESTARALSKAFAHDDGGVMPLDESWSARVSRRAQIKSDIGLMEKDVRQIENELKALMEHAAEGVLPDGRKITYRTSERKGYSVQPAVFRALRFPKSLEGTDDGEKE